jgi:hypothetical protein
MSTLTATLDALAGHAWAHTYTIVLAMEAKEVGAAHKAGQLQEQFGCSFHSIVFTLHSHEPGEMPGKASNVNSAVRQFYHMVTGDRSSYMLTVMDAGACVRGCLRVRGWRRAAAAGGHAGSSSAARCAGCLPCSLLRVCALLPVAAAASADALVPFEYVQQLESSSSTAPNAGSNVYAAPVLFEQDSSAVPGIVRATDYMWSALAAQNLNSWFGVGFPISNYRCVCVLVGVCVCVCVCVVAVQQLHGQACVRGCGALRPQSPTRVLPVPHDTATPPHTNTSPTA